MKWHILFNCQSLPPVCFACNFTEESQKIWQKIGFFKMEYNNQVHYVVCPLLNEPTESPVGLSNSPGSSLHGLHLCSEGRRAQASCRHLGCVGWLRGSGWRHCHSLSAQLYPFLCGGPQVPSGS